MVTTRAARATETGISRRPNRRQRWFAGGALLTATAVAGCGASGHSAGGPGVGPAGPANPAQTFSAIHGIPADAARTLRQTAKIGWRLEGAEVFGHVRAPVFGNGPFDLATARGREVLDLPEVKHQEPGTEHLIFLPSKVYLQPKASASAVLPRAKRWVSASIAGAESVSVNFPHFVAQIEGVNPVLLLSELKWGAVSAVPLGTGRQIVDHVQAQRYRVTVSLTRALAAARGPATAALGQAIQEQLVGAGASGSFTILTWVDRQGRVVQMRSTLPGTGEGSELMALSDFGSPARVTAPPASQVVDLTSLTPSGERENSGGGDTDGG
jgi:hypothetical protein